LGPANAVMHDQWEAYKAVGLTLIPKPFLLVTGCWCSDKCPEQKWAYDSAENTHMSACPTPWSPFQSTIQSDNPRASQFVPGANLPDKTSPDGKTEIFHILAVSPHVPPWPKHRDSLLYPAEFATIIHPGCKSASGFYLDCAKSAYTNSWDGCPKDLPPECKQERLWLR
jgi:hypothetical protein